MRRKKREGPKGGKGMCDEDGEGEEKDSSAREAIRPDMRRSLDRSCV